MQLDLHQNTPEWLELRRTKIGASDAPIIMGVSPWKTPLQLWKEKLGLSASSTMNSAMKRGHDLEAAARNQFEKMSGIYVEPAVFLHPEHDWMMASLDGISFDRKIGVEIKCPNEIDHSIALEGKVPEKYYPQLQHQIEVCSLEFIYYFSFNGKSGKIVEVARDDKYIDGLLKKEFEFLKLVRELESPKLSDKDFIDRKDADWTSTANEWKSVHLQIQHLQKREEELRNDLIELSGKHSSQGAGLKLSKVIKRGLVDYKAIPELSNVNLDQYRKAPSESWRLTLS